MNMNKNNAKDFGDLNPPKTFYEKTVAEAVAESKGYELPAAIDLKKCFEEPPPALDFVLPGFLAGTVGGLVSPGGVGKSWFALEVAMCIATANLGASNILQLNIERGGKVVVLAGEDPPEALHHRLHALTYYYDDPNVRNAIYENVSIVPTIGHAVDLSKISHCTALERVMEGARLVIIDTLTRFHSLDENSAADAKILMANIERLAKKTGAAIMYLHHVSKASALAGITELQQAARGSSVFVDNARWLSFVAGMSKDDAEEYNIPIEDRSQYLRWNISKQNYGIAITDRWFQRGEGGVLYPAFLKKKEKAKDGKKGWK